MIWGAHSKETFSSPGSQDGPSGEREAEDSAGTSAWNGCWKPRPAFQASAEEWEPIPEELRKRQRKVLARQRGGRRGCFLREEPGKCAGSDCEGSGRGREQEVQQDVL